MRQPILETYKADSKKFGGIIYPSDFNTHYANGTIASRIEADKKFDEQCRKNMETALWRNRK